MKNSIPESKFCRLWLNIHKYINPQKRNVTRMQNEK